MSADKAEKKKGPAPDWKSADGNIAIWMKRAEGRQPKASVAYGKGSEKVNLIVYTNIRGIQLAAADVGAILENKAVYSEALQTKAEPGEQPKTYKGFLCLKEVKEVPWKSAPSKSDNVVDLAVVLPMVYPDSGKIRGYVYNKKAVFAHIKSGDHHVGDLTPRQVVQLIDEPGTKIQFGKGESAYTVRLDRFDPPAEGFENEVARLSVTRGESHELIEQQESQEEAVAASAGQSV